MPKDTAASDNLQSLQLLGDDTFDTPEVEALHRDLQATQSLILHEPSSPQERKQKVN